MKPLTAADEARLNAWTRACTAFRTWEELVQACQRDGYVPTLPSTNHCASLVALELKGLGLRAWCPQKGDY